ncbi:MAG: hypothetical protein RLY93_15905 [Sumerlaeia bacterium]
MWVFTQSAPLPAQPPELRGAVLPLYAADPDFDYGFAIDELGALGVNAVNLTVVLLQENGTSTEIYRKAGRTIPDNALRRTIRQCHARGMATLLFPIVLLESPGPDEWRGNMAPADLDAWFEDYRSWILHYARIANEENCDWVSIGSEFSSLEIYAEQWEETISAVRAECAATSLTYSCNWDHLFGPELWWDRLDAIGLSSYYELTKDQNADQAALDSAWRIFRSDILEWRREQALDHLPLLLTEVGYPSLDGGAVYPWDYTLKNPPDLREQARAYQAFISAWDGRPELGGVFFYKWLGFETQPERGYSPRGKPAEFVIRAWLAPEDAASPPESPSLPGR